MIKVAMIGAGSVVFSRNLTGDILGIPGEAVHFVPKSKGARYCSQPCRNEGARAQADLAREARASVGVNAITDADLAAYIERLPPLVFDEDGSFELPDDSKERQHDH